MHTIFLRTSLFTLPDDGHVPVGTLILKAEIIDRPSGGIIVRTKSFHDAKGKVLGESAVELQLPWSKIDHIWTHED